ncbi:amidase [Sinorhizobium sp. BG8]|uniref:amidase n=1 Tax=Sinorhizobium sp. BG8 TaxID=2613773 RepID=UPI00193E7F2E|nr:amidase [Sinorhizobium sp. BG8]QRM57687.1 amidase [Sinorhizobium sp. BG8]
MPTDTAFLSVASLATGYRNGAFTPLDVCRRALERLTEWEPKLNAFIDPMREAVLKEAAKATAELASGIDKGTLHGVPVAIKDIIDVEGIATTFATKAVAPRIAATDAECVRRLRSAGAIVFGKTNLLEFAYGIVHPDFGQTNNPFDPTRTAGGSSGGSAAAVAAGIVPLSLGTDTGGSVRAPASYCGIVGFKPSFGALPLDGVYPLSQSLDHLGVLARSAEDAGLAFAAMRNAEASGAGAVAGKERLQGLRLGVVRNQWRHPSVEPGVRDCIDAALRRMQTAGVQMVEIDLPDPQAMASTLLDILLPEAAAVHAEAFARNPEGFAAGTREQISAGMAKPAVVHLEAKARQQAWRDELGALLRDLDGLIAPTVPFVAPDSDPALSADGDDEIVSLTHANLTGAPSISLPCGKQGVLPVGIQLTGAIGCDTHLLAIARALQDVL